jgi:predicted metal-binding membrane protein
MGRRVEAQGAPLIAAGWFAGAYLIVWVAFSLLATLAQWALERGGLLDAEMASTSNILGGLAFVAAGTYQWTRLKQACLVQCQRPFAFLLRHGGFRRDARGSVVLGLRHGAYCVGCCWVLMSLLLVGGVMNPLWIALIALLILLEKVAPPGRLIARLAGIVLVATGAWLLARPFV